MAEHLEFGAGAEALVAARLEAMGWKVLARNWRCRYGELDLVAQDGATLVFVEVKARSSRGAGTPEEAVDAAKQARLSRSAGEYLAAHGLLERTCRFDVVAVEGGEVRHHRAAFAASGGTTA